MTVPDLQVLFDYGHWANKKLFDVLLRMTPEQFTRTLDGSRGCLRDTMVHIVSVEWGWISRCGGPARGPWLQPLDYPTVESLVATWTRVARLAREFLADLRDEDLSRPVEFSIEDCETCRLSVGELLQHAANHGVHHRGQVSLLLRLLGQTPEDFDILFYFGDKQRLQAS